MSLAAPATFSMVIFSHVHFSLWTVFLTVCVCCVQRKAGTWTSWMILWSVCLSLPVTTLCGRSPPSRTPVTSITAPVLSPGTQRKRLNLHIDLWRLTLWLLTFCMKPAGFMMSCVTIHCNKLRLRNISISIISILPLFFPVFQYWVWPWLWLLCHRWCDQEDQGVWVWHSDPGRSGHPLPC